MRRMVRMSCRLAALGVAGLALPALADEQPDYPPFEEVSKGYTQVVSTADGAPSLYTVWRREKDGQLLAELPQGWQGQKHFIALTLATGSAYAGLQSGDMYVYWRQYDKRLALIAPNISVRSTGDDESKAGVKHIFTDRVLLDLPIVAMGPHGQPVIDLDEMLVQRADVFYGGSARGNPALASVKVVKAFPQNVEVAFELPMSDGVLREIHYSISLIPDSTGYEPRRADERLGYFTTVFNDLGKADYKDQWVRYINRWHLEKRDPSLKLSPPKNPIVFYVDHTTPVRYRRFVREGTLYWNKAFEKVGIKDAIEVYYQDAATGAHMDKDPEDVRYNFIRWLNNDMGTAIGPSRVHPLTGQILDADIILTDGWIRHFWQQYNELLPEVAMEGMGPRELAWLADRPNWDPRLRLLPPAERREALARRAARGFQRFGGHPAANADPSFIGDDEFDGLGHVHSQKNGLCLAARGKAFDVALMRMHMEMADPELLGQDAEQGAGEGTVADTLDGIPDWFVGPLLADLVAHEVGHTLGLRHNFKASSVYPLSEINSTTMKGRKPYTGSVMDYNPLNINMNSGPVQGDWTMIDIGPYDMWVIEYGYTFESDLKPVLARCVEPELVYATDEDTWGPDPLARRYDFAADPYDYAVNLFRLAEYHRGRLLDKFVKDGESWSKARHGYDMTLGTQMQAISIMANWLGGSNVVRDKKGDPGNRAPVTPVSAQQQRKALKFVIDHTFNDAAFGLTPDLLSRLTVDKWWDEGGMDGIFEDPTWPVHDRIMGIQAAAMTMLLTPTRLERVLDNEYKVAPDQDALTIAEIMGTIKDAAWTEITRAPDRNYTARQPMISSLRRNLQREHLERLIDLSLPGAGFSAAYKPISNLATQQLRELHAQISGIVGEDASPNARLDPYTLSHLAEAKLRIAKALDAQYIYNTDAFGGVIYPAGVFLEDRQAPVTPKR